MSSRRWSQAAFAVAFIALVCSFTGAASAARQAIANVVGVPKPNAVLKLDKQARFPAKAIPKVAAARKADRLGGSSEADLTNKCAADEVDLGAWCLQASPFPVPPEDAAKANFFYATATCTSLGGFLPDAGMLIGAASRVKLASTIDDSQLTAATDIDPTDGLKDRREMSSTLITTQAGASAAGSEGISDGSKGDPKSGEPDPVPQPSNPFPETLQYVTVFDNHDKGGFAGSKPVSATEQFRCAFDKRQGDLSEDQ